MGQLSTYKTSLLKNSNLQYITNSWQDKIKKPKINVLVNISKELNLKNSERFLSNDGLFMFMDEWQWLQYHRGI